MSDRWSRLHLQQGDLALTVLPGVGGRLWDVRFQGRSLLFQNPDLDGHPIDDTRLADLPTRSPQFGFPLWGGEKTWIAPDSAWRNGAPFPALDSGAYRVTSSDSRCIALTSPVCPLSHLSITRRLTLDSATGWTMDHSVTNHGSEPRLTGIWSVMMFDTPAKIGVAMDQPAFHPVFGSARGLVSAHDTCVVADCSARQEFKLGLRNPDGRTLIRCGEDGLWLTCSVPEPAHKAFAHAYPFEVFNSGDYAYCEAEWHSPAQTLRPMETMRFHQRFRLHASPDAAQTHSSVEDLVSCMS